MAAEYSRGRNFISSAKLNYLHHFLKQLSGYTLHPSIELGPMSSGPRVIADMGTQTGAWALDLAESHPPKQLHVNAFDLSDKFIPPRTWLPSNVSFHVQDVCAAFAPTHWGQYDVVHFRLFLTLTQDRLEAMLDNAMRLLKPGGYVQWIEHDKTRLKSVAADPSLSLEAADAFIKMQQQPGYNTRWVLDIAPTMEAKGLNILADEDLQARLSMLPQLSELHLMALMDVPPGMSKIIDEFKENHLEQLTGDHLRGVAVMDTFKWVVGQKPLT